MKCFVLAGGSGDALWPLSRRNYPKQFIEINKGRSLFQETIARNLPFCDDFYVIANEKYENIIKGQLHVFQGLSYHLFLEQLGRQTAPAVAIAALCVTPDEDVLVVSTDHMIGEGDYNGTIVKAQQMLSDDGIVAIGCRNAMAAQQFVKGHNYFDVYQDGRIVYIPADRSVDFQGKNVCIGGDLSDSAESFGGDLSDSVKFFSGADGSSYFEDSRLAGKAERFSDSGIFLVKAGTYLRAIQENRPELYEACLTGKNRMQMKGSAVILTKEWLFTIPSVSIGEAVYQKWAECGKVALVAGEFAWSRLLNLESVAEISAPQPEAEYESIPQLESRQEFMPVPEAERELVSQPEAGQKSATQHEKEQVSVPGAEADSSASGTSVSETSISKSTASDGNKAMAVKSFSTGPQDILHHCSDVSVLNETEDKIVVVNDLSEILIVNTKDAVYISRKGSSSEIKEIVEENYSDIAAFPKQGVGWLSGTHAQSLFDEGDIYYATWGIKETLNRSEGYLVKKLTIFPGHSLDLHKHEKRSEHWSIVSGTATILMDGQEKEYQRNESIFVPVGTFHRIANQTAKDLVVIEVSIGESASGHEIDMIRMDEAPVKRRAQMVRLLPVYKDYLWGGRRLGDLFGMDNHGEKMAESWVLSAHKDGVCRVVAQDDEMRGQTVQNAQEPGGQIQTEQKYDGYSAQAEREYGEYSAQTEQKFDEYLMQAGREVLGWKCQPYERFPLLMKYIDAMQPLSIQVHPDDKFAMPVENDYGKNEMWYVIKAQPGAFIYLGFERDTTQEECRQRIQDGTLDEILHKVLVKEGDSIFVGAGTVHAINEGVVILEVQQSSNATYRLFDYNRTDKNGELRPLHLEKAFANINFKANTTDGRAMGEWEDGRGCKKRLLQQCKYFSVTAYRVEEEMEISMDDSTFYAIVFVEGKGTILAGEVEMRYHAGESFFIPAGKKMLKISGRAHFVLSHV